MKNTHGGKRPGSGRKRKYNYPIQVVSVKMPTALAEKLDRQASARKKSRNQWIVDRLSQPVE